MKITKTAHALILVVILAIIAIGSYLYNSTSYLREIKTYPVVMTEAYSSMLNVGKGNTKEVFRGRFFHADTNLLIERSIDGFYYQRFLDGGKKPLAGTLQLSRLDLNEKEPARAVNGLLGVMMGLVALFMYGLLALFGFFTDFDKRRYTY